MQNKIPSRQRLHQRGQTMVLVAISLVSLLAMAALAIDIVTLYAARSEIQRAADAAALAGAKALADSSITTLLLTDANFGIVKPWAENNKDKQIDAVLSNNLVAGQKPTVVSATVDWSRQGNPHLTVSLKRTTLPTFFSKIWSQSAATVTATATAEVYNPANLTSITPIAPKSVKPWLVANADPINVGTPFVDTTTPNWVVDSAVIGQPFDLVSACNGITTPCVPNPNPPKFPVGATTPQVEYVPAQVTPNTANVCPSSVGSCNSSCLGASDYELSVECADMNAYTYLNCGGGSTNITWDNTVNPGGAAGASATGAQCLIHAAGPGLDPQRDTLNPLWPAAPMQITGGSCSVKPAQLVANSSSIVTIPIIDTVGAIPAAGGSVTVVGFLQAFINHVDGSSGAGGAPPAGSINITVLNIAGCSSSNNGANPVVGGSGSSPVPVRLITPP
jgi:Flp pilus assembly protein TadG